METYLEHVCSLVSALGHVLRLGQQVIQQCWFIQLPHQLTLQTVLHVVHQEVHHCFRHTERQSIKNVFTGFGSNYTYCWFSKWKNNTLYSKCSFPHFNTLLFISLTFRKQDIKCDQNVWYVLKFVFSNIYIQQLNRNCAQSIECICTVSKSIITACSEWAVITVRDTTCPGCSCVQWGSRT